MYDPLAPEAIQALKARLLTMYQQRGSGVPRQLDNTAEPDAVAVIDALLGQAAELRLILSWVVSADTEAAPNGLMDCVDNDGHPYQSASMAGHITHARLLCQPWSMSDALKSYYATRPTTPVTEER